MESYGWKNRRTKNHDTNNQIETSVNRIVFILHYEDVKEDNVNRLMSECQGQSFLIKVQSYKNWKDVIKQILSCEYVVSTSLHGLILADAYGVPNQWITLQNRSDFKYKDYYSSVGKKAISIRITDETRIEELLEKMKMYEPIVFDPKPLLRACPFPIINPAIISIMKTD